MRGVFDSRFARPLRVTDESGTRVLRGFIQPLSVTKPETPDPTPAGTADRRRYLLIAEGAELSGSAEVRDGTAVYALLRRELIAGHLEGVLLRKGAAGDA